MTAARIGMRGLLFIVSLVLVGPGCAGAADAVDPKYAAGREVIAGLDRIVTPNGVQETFEVTLGGARQVVDVRGSDRTHPILVWLHGGPGAVEMPFAWSFQRPWEDFFTVVQWDQRGAGRSYPLNDPDTLAPTMTIERYREDAIELIELLKKRYGQQKVFLLGHSWGSVVGLSVAAHRPDLLYAYVGMGQLIDAVAGERAGYDWTLAEARRRGRSDAVAELEALAPFPGDFSDARIDAERKWAVAFGGLFDGRSDGDFYWRLARLSPDYDDADRKAWGDGSEFSVRILEPQLRAVSFVALRRLACPVFMFEGRHDELIPSSITAAWLRRLQAPKKRLVWFEHSGHMMMVEEPGRVLGALIDEVLPLARSANPGRR